MITVIVEEAIIMVETITMEEAVRDPMVITTMVDSREIIPDTGEMEMLAIIITIDSPALILNPRKISVKCSATSSITRVIMLMNAQKIRPR